MRHCVVSGEYIDKVAKLDENPRNIPNASLNCHKDKRLPTTGCYGFFLSKNGAGGAYRVGDLVIPLRLAEGPMKL
jgi:hypothetical protein